jgi:phosphate transport system substrate-binding protein
MVRNTAGVFVQADLESIAAAASRVQALAPNFRISITNAPGRKSYPVAAFTYPLKAADGKKGTFLRDLPEWVFTSGQRQSAARSRPRVRQAIDSLR